MNNIIIDTNILVNYAFYKLDPKNSNMSSYFWKYSKSNTIFNKNKIFIPDITWIEFLGFFLQKDIDFENYELWYRNRHSVVAKIWKDIKNEKIEIIQPNEWYNELSDVVQELLQEEAEKEFVEELLGNIEERKIKNTAEKRNDKSYNKIYDGMDGLIAGYAFFIASRYSDEKFIFVSDDVNLIRAINYNIKKGILTSEGKWPSNLEAMQLRSLTVK